MRKVITWFVIILIGFPLLFYIAGFMYLLQKSHMRMSYIANTRQQHITQHKQKYIYVFQTIFPAAKLCVDTLNNVVCTTETRNLLDANLHSTLGGVSRAPIFFIRLKDDKQIEKLYQSGDYKVDTVDTKGEQMIVEMLKDTRNPISYPQYTCCGGDDILADFPILGKFLPPRVYLKDFYSEIEQIFLIRDDKNTILGATVNLYGD
jgi:hypothetical protein